MPESLLRATGLVKTYRRGGVLGTRRVKALDGVDLSLEAATTIALVGASGSGKSTLGRCLALLERPDAGEIYLEGRPVADLPRPELATARRRVQLLFQDPKAALNPRMRCVDAVAEPLLARRIDASTRRREAAVRMAEVGLGEDLMERRTCTLSGGQCQRLTLARALAAKPRLLILDEGLASLDLSLQAQVVNLLLDLQQRHHLAYLLISHDLRLAAHLAQWIAVMAAGRLVENGKPHELLARPRHAETRSLVDAMIGG